MQPTPCTMRLFKGSLITSAVLTAMLSPSLLASPNNGYTTAANVYSGSASRSWFGGGTAYAISQWKAERQAASIVESQNMLDATEQPATTSTDTAEPTAP
ncbi:MAG: hypothetical protein ACWA44_09020 [Thiotrichales bacterium]